MLAVTLLEYGHSLPTMLLPFSCTARWAASPFTAPSCFLCVAQNVYVHVARIDRTPAKTSTPTINRTSKAKTTSYYMKMIPLLTILEQIHRVQSWVIRMVMVFQRFKSLGVLLRYGMEMNEKTNSPQKRFDRAGRAFSKRQACVVEQPAFVDELNFCSLRAL